MCVCVYRGVSVGDVDASEKRSEAAGRENANEQTAIHRRSALEKVTLRIRKFGIDCYGLHTTFGLSDGYTGKHQAATQRHDTS